MRSAELTPLFSIITVCYNAGHTIGRTIESVDAQTCSDYEHVIIDGVSTDDTLVIANEHRSPRRFVFSERDNGIYDAMNKGMSLTKGRYLIFLNAGDKFHAPDTLERMRKAVEENAEEPGILYGQTAIVDDNGKYLGPRHLKAPKKLTLKSFATGMVVCHQAFVPLRRIADGYSPYYRFSADYDWCIKCLQHSRNNVYLGDEPLIDYLNEGVTTRNHGASLRERFKIMARYYGTLPTIIRHIGFAFRTIVRKIKN